MEINLSLYNNESNRYAVEELKELFGVIGMKIKVQEEDNEIQLSFDYDSYTFRKKMKRNAGRKPKSTGKLTFGDVEELLRTHSVEEIAEMAKISVPTCYRRIAKLKKYQSEELAEELKDLKGMYRSYDF